MARTTARSSSRNGDSSHSRPCARDKWASSCANTARICSGDNVANNGLPGLAEAGVVPTAVEAVVPSYLYRYRKGGQYAEVPAGAF